MPLGLAVLIAGVCLMAPPDRDVLIRPAREAGPLDNPLKGWCPYPNAEKIGQPYSMVFVYTSWRELEPKEGEYAFEAWENRAWSVPAARGKHVVFRIYLDYPKRRSGVPDWLVKQGVKLTPYTDHGGGLSPDYADPRLVAGLERLIAAMGKRYDANPRVGFIELGLLGHWGEWHTFPRENLYAGPRTESRVIDAYKKAFPHKVVMARTATALTGQQDWLGYHDDMFPEDTDNGEHWAFMAGIYRSGRGSNWTRAAIGGEMVPFAAKTWLEDQYGKTLEMLRRGHFSWIGPYNPALEKAETPEFQAHCEQLVRLMGYQFRLTEIRLPAEIMTGQTISFTIAGENEGIAPFYYPWNIEFALIDQADQVVERLPLKADLRTWLPGAFRVEGSVVVKAPPDDYRLAIGIIDPWTNRPAITFANALPRVGRWNVIGPVVVDPVH